MIWDVAEMMEAEQQEMLEGDSAVVSLDLPRTLRKLPGVTILQSSSSYLCCIINNFFGFHKYY